MSLKILTLLIASISMTLSLHSTELPGTLFMGQQDSYKSRFSEEYLRYHIVTNDVYNLGRIANTWKLNDSGDKLSYVGVTFEQRSRKRIRKIKLTMATFYDGGWFGSGNPGENESLDYRHLKAPKLQLSKDGVNWKTVQMRTNYVKQLKGHIIGNRSEINPTVTPEITFILKTPYRGVKALRLIGEEGGITVGDKNGFIGVTSLKVYTED